MNPAHITLVVGVALAVIGLTLLAWVRFQRATTIVWAPLSELNDMQFNAPPGFDLDFLRAAIDNAQGCLTSFTNWTPAQVVDATHNVRVLVNPAKQWRRGGELIAGQCNVETGVMEVGADLSALCHELGHLCQWRIDGVRDDAHGTRWQARGIERAISAYLAGLARRRPGLPRRDEPADDGNRDR